MSSQYYAPYRGCSIEVHVTLSKAHAVGGIYRRFKVSCTIAFPDHPERKMVTFPEQFDFLSEKEALRYGESRARTFIDSVLSTPSHRWDRHNCAGGAD
ncbi:hypothetical protein Bphy_4771 [Paraburkholderia phymatum STM815]|uniref:Uncharacterized protein n=1 Tax=Paraburkholderia phymatum (strain DSM 17167 / CIP 108236 / LMG 21445 / STM815) TaxID=391038 RepID=B2JRW1_PARP8|nr:hypothetical protein Bphy_4771 [Paraburkholderia phymatum STM815]